MAYWQYFISVNTILAYWLITHAKHRRMGLWWTLFAECNWMALFAVLKLYGLLPISVIMFGITVKRLMEEK